VTSNTVSNAVVAQQNGPMALVKTNTAWFAGMLPSHIKPETWIRLAQGALRKGKRQTDGAYELEVAATNNPQAFMAALNDAARLGLEPGTEQYYLTPRKVKGRLEILGIVGYQGYVELMYRAGAVSSVIAEVVYAKDQFTYQPGRDEIPQHEIDWDADDRGPLRLVYAYARMKDGAYSKVVVLNKAAIGKIKEKATGAEGEYSPWRTDEAAMWLKSAVRQLQKWVPTSAEYIREQLRAVRDVAAEPPAVAATQDPPHVNTETGEVVDGELVDPADNPGFGAQP
jgi:recombination protein RecT